MTRIKSASSSKVNVTHFGTSPIQQCIEMTSDRTQKRSATVNSDSIYDDNGPTSDDHETGIQQLDTNTTTGDGTMTDRNHTEETNETNETDDEDNDLYSSDVNPVTMGSDTVQDVNEHQAEAEEDDDDDDVTTDEDDLYNPGVEATVQ
eukprot:UN08680